MHKDSSVMEQFFQALPDVFKCHLGLDPLHLQAFFNGEENLPETEESDDGDDEVKPSHERDVPKVIRSFPLTISIPTAARMNPRKMATRDFKADFPPNRVMALNVRTMTAAVSGGPNFRANSAMIGAKKVSRMTPNNRPDPMR